MFETKKADWYFIIPTALVWISGLIITAWDFIQLQGARYDLGLLSIVGVVLILAGAVIRQRAIRALGRYFSSGLRTLEEHKLVKDDLYKHIRHPAYTGFLLVWFGVPLLLSSLYGFLLMLLFIPCFLYRMKVEENMLIEKFGNEYKEYMRNSKKLIPYVY